MVVKDSNECRKHLATSAMAKLHTAYVSDWELRMLKEARISERLEEKVVVGLEEAVVPEEDTVGLRDLFQSLEHQ